MYTLYYAPGTASLAVHWMLIELGVPFDLVKVDTKAKAQKTPDYLAINPAGRVPAMIVDGKAHAETTALLMLLAERHPEAGFSPAPDSPERADYLQWMIYLANTLMPAFRAWYYPDEPAGPEHVEAVKHQLQPVIEGVFARFESVLADGRPYLLGAKMSAADFLLTMLARWSRTMPKTASAWPHLGAYIDRMRAMPSLRDVHHREGLTDWIDG